MVVKSQVSAKYIYTENEETEDVLTHLKICTVWPFFHYGRRYLRYRRNVLDFFMGKGLFAFSLGFMSA